VCANKHNPTALDGFPLYWTVKLKLIKPKSLDELFSADRGVCEALASLKIIFNTLQLIACERAYISREDNDVSSSSDLSTESEE